MLRAKQEMRGFAQGPYWLFIGLFASTIMRRVYIGVEL